MSEKFMMGGGKLTYTSPDSEALILVSENIVCSSPGSEGENHEWEN